MASRAQVTRGPDANAIAAPVAIEFLPQNAAQDRRRQWLAISLRAGNALATLPAGLAEQAARQSG